MTMVTVPLPVPLLPPVIVMNDALLVAVHGEGQLVVTAIDAVAPVATTFKLVVDSE